MTNTDTQPLEPDATDPDDRSPADRPNDGQAKAARRTDGGEVEAGTADEPDRSTDADGLSWPDVRRKLLLSAIAVLALLATWATFQVYTSTSRAIGLWLSDGYVPIFQAVFNVAVVLVALAGILALVRELS